MTDLTHIKENNSDSQQHLEENRQKFETDAVFLLRLMKMGKRLTRLSVVKDYGIDGRRLGELHSEGQCKKSWKINDKGKRLYVEYYVPIPKMLTKTELCNLVQKELF